MNDPHVVALHYKLVLGESVQFSPPTEPLEFEMADFHCMLRDTHLRLEPREHYKSRDAAKGVVDPLIQAWALEAAVRLNVPTLRIEYERTELVDRAPGPGMTSLYLEATVRVTASASATGGHRLSEYPPPPSPGFEVSPDVDTLWRRYTGYVAGREPLLAMAYFAYTVVTVGVNGRVNAAARYNMEEAVLRKVSELSSIRGDVTTARKATQSPQPLTAEETTWLEAAVRALIVQLGLSAHGVPSTRLGMADLPRI
jgi:hypothetical protein